MTGDRLFGPDEAFEAATLAIETNTPARTEHLLAIPDVIAIEYMANHDGHLEAERTLRINLQQGRVVFVYHPDGSPIWNGASA